MCRALVQVDWCRGENTLTMHLTDAGRKQHTVKGKLHSVAASSQYTLSTRLLSTIDA